MCPKDSKFSDPRLPKLEQQLLLTQRNKEPSNFVLLKKVYFKLKGTDVQCCKSHTFVDLADKPSKLHFVSVPIESASHLQLTHAGPQFGPVSHYRIRIPDLR